MREEVYNNSEMALISLCLSNKKIFENHAIRLDKTHFTSAETRALFNSMVELNKDEEVKEFDTTILIDTAMMLEPKINKETLANVLVDSIMINAIESNAKKYIKQLIENKSRKDLREKNETILKMIEDGKSAADIALEMGRAANEVQNGEDLRFGKSPAEFFKEHYELVMELKGKPFGYLTGWEKFDEMIQGFERGTVTTIAARPSMGKTALGVNITYKLAMNKVKTLFFSAEMSGQDISSRFLPFLTDIGTKYNKDYNYLERSEYSKEVVEWGMKELAKLPLSVDDHPALAIEDIEYKLPIYAREGYKVFVIDYVQFIQMRGRTGQGKEHEKISYIMSSLKTLAKKYDVAIVVLAQIGRGIEGRDKNEKRPMLSDLKGSGSIEENSDKVIAIHRPWFYLNSFSEEVRAKRANKVQQAELVVLKNRNGAVGEVKFWYLMDYNAFIERDDEPPIFDWDLYLEKIVRPLKERGMYRMKISKGQATQEEYNNILKERNNKKHEEELAKKEKAKKEHEEKLKLEQKKFEEEEAAKLKAEVEKLREEEKKEIEAKRKGWRDASRDGWAWDDKI